MANQLTFSETGSSIGASIGSGSRNLTSTALSTNILLAVPTIGGGFRPIGAVQTLTVNEKRNISAIDEVGTDGHIDSAPRSSTDIDGTCKRTRFDGMRVAEAFGRGFVHVSSQAYPFDIVVFDKSRLAQSDRITTVIKNVWITSISYTYSKDDWIIVDDMGWQAETIYSFLGATTQNSGNSAAQGGINKITPISVIDQEWRADTGQQGRRGALDAAGLLDLGSSGDLW